MFSKSFKDLLIGLPGIFVYWITSLPAVVYSLIGLMILDVISGMIVAAKRCEISSQKSDSGMSKKVLQLIMVAAAGTFAHGLHLPVDLAGICAAAFCVSEMISICENACMLGVPMPDILMRAINASRKAVGSNNKGC